MIALLAKLTSAVVGNRLARPAAAILMVVAALALIGLANRLARADAVRDYRRELAAAQARADAAQRTREATATVTRARELAAGDAADAARTKELTDATRHLPDARPSDRARVRLCLEPGLRDTPACRAANASR